MGGPPPQEQIDATLAWVTERFAAHYAARPPDPPARFTRREFGFLWNGKKFFLRHTGFSSVGALHAFLAREGPHHAYYSTAYYKTPHASTMKEKEWLGADLIFDLDADHLPGAAEMSYEEQLREVKRQARKLLREYLLGDFGFDPDHVHVVFSGGRGYHFHVTDPRVHQLGGAERREIVDYVSPNDSVIASLFDEWIRERAWSKEFGRTKKDPIVFPAHAPGWNGRITRTVAGYLDEIRALDPPAARERLMELQGVGPKKADDILSEMTAEKVLRLRETGLLPSSLADRRVLQGLVEMAKVVAPGETDEPVTADIKRLIRLPGSLHGKTGLRVVPLSIDAFETFDPLRDAVAFDDEPVEVIVSKPQEVALGGRREKIDAGRQELPLSTAMFLVLRRSALRPFVA